MNEEYKTLEELEEELKEYKKLYYRNKNRIETLRNKLKKERENKLKLIKQNRENKREIIKKTKELGEYIKGIMFID